MSACPVLNYQNVSPAAWDCLKQAAAAAAAKNHFQLPNPFPDSGILSHLGFSGRWDYNAAAQTLAIQCTGHLIMSCDDINKAVDSAVKGTGCIH